MLYITYIYYIVILDLFLRRKVNENNDRIQSLRNKFDYLKAIIFICKNQRIAAMLKEKSLFRKYKFLHSFCRLVYSQKLL